MKDFSSFGENAGYIEELYKEFLSDPASVSAEWASFFAGVEQGHTKPIAVQKGTAILPKSASAKTSNISPAHESARGVGSSSMLRPSQEKSGQVELNAKVFALISAYRSRGHFKAMLNPLSQGVPKLPDVPELNLEAYKFSQADLHSMVGCLGFRDADSFRLLDLIQELQRTYCSTVGFEFEHLSNPQERAWLQARIEAGFAGRDWYTKEQKLAFLRKLIESELLDSELHLKYAHSKNYSLRGAESLNIIFESLLNYSASKELEEIYVGMPHRGRLNVLANVFKKPLAQVLKELDDKSSASLTGQGDLLYHQAYSSELEVALENGRKRKLRMNLVSNPSHLEWVDAVLAGMLRAKQDKLVAGRKKHVLGLLLHGDAALCGQGVAWETVNLSALDGYATEGIVHIIINNQIGFTANVDECRSSVYCSDVLKAAGIPVFHVNSEDIEACSWIAELALEYRNTFGKDVVIDLYCYRKFGHNDGEDPSYTQPLMYAEIKSRKSLAEMYGQHLINEELIGDDNIREIEAAVVGNIRASFAQSTQLESSNLTPQSEQKSAEVFTAVDSDKLRVVASALLESLNSFEAPAKVQSVIEKRAANVTQAGLIDWPGAEELAFGTLLLENCNLRLTGQDCVRGTFAQRNIELHHARKDDRFYPLNELISKMGASSFFEAYNSPLSEAAVLGFEFGYAAQSKQSLVMWEAQYGDFANCAQVIIDQFIASSESKWKQNSGVTLLLPHGYEGEGPEHSSARIERFLSLCAQKNMSVCYPTSAAQYFHLLRRQGHSTIKRPLIIFTPKSKIFSADYASPFAEFTQGYFRPMIESNFGPTADNADVIFLSGKIFFDIEKALRESCKKAVKVIRIEELYPFPEAQIQLVLSSIKARSISWVQEEPRNMGAYLYVKERLSDILPVKINYVGPEPASSIASSSKRWHMLENKSIIEAIVRVVES